MNNLDRIFNVGFGIIAFLCLLTPMLAADELSASSAMDKAVFKELISVDQGLTSASADYKFCNPFSKEMDFSSALSEFYSYPAKGFDSEILIEKTLSRKAYAPMITYKNSTKTYIDNKTGKTATRIISIPEITYKERDENYISYEPIKGEMIKSGDCRNIRHIIEYPLRYGTSPIDFFPYMNTSKTEASIVEKAMVDQKIYRKEWLWLNASWGARIPFNITETTGARLVNMNVNFTFDMAALVAAGKMQKTGADIRIADASNNEYSFWLQDYTNNTAKAVVRILIPALAASETRELYMYIDNPSATSLSNIYLAFPNGGSDDFNKVYFNQTYWVNNSASNLYARINKSITGADSVAWLRSTSGYMYFRHDQAISKNKTYIEASMKHETPTGAFFLINSGVINTEFGGDFSSGFHWSGTSVVCVSGNCNTTSQNAINGGFYTATMESDGQTFVSSLYNESWTRRDFYSKAELGDVEDTGISVQNYIAEPNGYIDFIFSQNFTGSWATMPTITLGVEEASAANYRYVVVESPIDAVLSDMTATLIYTPVSTSEIKNCSFVFNTSAAIYLNSSPVNANSSNYENFTIASSFMNQNISFNISCDDGIVFSNESSFYVHIPIANATIGYDIQIEWGDPTSRACANATHLNDNWAVIVNGRQFNKSKSYFCDYGCNESSCNMKPDRMNYIILLVGSLIFLLIIIILKRR